MQDVMYNNMKQRFTVIGISDSQSPQFDAETMSVIASGTLFSGGRRHRELVAHLLPAGARWIEITVPLDDVFRQYEAYDHIIVFASGDPLFFGFGATLQRRLPDAEIVVCPVRNSLQHLAHRAVLPYGDMRTVSLTGREWRHLDRALLEGASKIGILTDREHTPAAIASRLLEYGYDGYEIIVGERLGNELSETVRRLSLSEAAGMQFEMPNCVILSGTPRPVRFGLPESEFQLLDGRAGMITKMPVRLTALAAAELERADTFWDIGFCTGSVSIEARLQFPRLQVVAFEIRPEGEQLMHENARRFGALGIEAVIGDFLSVPLDKYPAPDAVFLGGYGGRLEEVVHRISRQLRPGGRLVFNSVSDTSESGFLTAARHSGLTLAGRHRIVVDDHNPITVIKVIKPI